MDKRPIWGVIAAFATAMISVALSKFSVGPWVWGAILAFAVVILLVSIVMMVRGTPSRIEKISGITPSVPLKWWVSISHFARLTPTDSMFSEGSEGDYSLYVDTRYQMLRPVRVDIFSMELMGERIDGTALTGQLLHRNSNGRLHFMIPRGLCKGRPTAKVVAYVSGQEIPSKNSLPLVFDE